MKINAALIGLFFGIGLGLAASITESPALLYGAKVVEPLGQIFLRAVQMVVIPLVAVVVFTGVGRIGSLQKLGQMGGLAVGFFLVTALPAILIGMGVMSYALSLSPPMPPPTNMAEVGTEVPGTVDFLINLIPKNPIESAANGALLPLIIFVIFFAVASTTLSAEKQRILASIAEAIGDTLMKMMGQILRATPVGVFSLAAPMIARTGMSLLENLAIFIIAVIVGLFFLKGFVFLPLVWILGKVGPKRFILSTMRTYMVGFSTTTSVGTLPTMLQEAEKMGLSRDSFTLVLPLAASLNRPGSVLFQSSSLVFLASMYGIPLNLELFVTMVLILLMTSMTVAPIPSASIMSMVTALNAIGVPTTGLGVLLGVDRIPDVFRTATNVIGHMAAATVVDAVSKESTHPNENP